MNKTRFCQLSALRRCQLVFSLSLLPLFASFQVSADRLYFTDGESITGALVGVDGGKVSWTSAILGDLAVELAHVEYIETGDRYDLKTTGRELSNCWMYLQSGQQLLHCDEGVESLANWKLVVSAGVTATEPGPLLELKGGVRVALEDSSGNTDITKYDVETRTELRYVETRHTIALRYQEESAQSETTRNYWRGSYQYDQFLGEQWFSTGNAFYEEDKFRQLDRRTSVGLGLGYQFLDTNYFSLTAKGTLNYVDERFTTGLTRYAPAFLWNLNFSWLLREGGASFFHRHVMMQAFDQGDDFEVSTTTGLRYPINGKLSSVLQLEYDYDNLPAENELEKVDRKWSLGLIYDW